MHIFDLTRILRRGCRHEAGHGESVFVSVGISPRRDKINHFASAERGPGFDQSAHLPLVCARVKQHDIGGACLTNAHGTVLGPFVRVEVRARGIKYGVNPSAADIKTSGAKCAPKIKMLCL
jgi:hypothetical protein